MNRVLNFESPIDVGVKIEKQSDSESIAKDKKLSDDMIENNQGDIKVWPFVFTHNLTLYKVITEVQYWLYSERRKLWRLGTWSKRYESTNGRCNQ